MKILYVLGMCAALVGCAYSVTPTQYQAARDAVVIISNGKGHGTGFMVSDSIVVSNRHVLENDELTAEFYNGEKYTIKYVQSCEKADCAYGFIERYEGPHLDMACRDPVYGERVYAVKNPNRLRWAISDGVISSERKDIDEKESLYNVSWAVMAGESGSPVIAHDGVLAISTAFYVHMANIMMPQALTFGQGGVTSIMEICDMIYKK